MIKLDLLTLVQDMLTVIDSEDVTALADTEEAGMCVNLANQAFEEMATQGRWRHFRDHNSSWTTTSNANELTMPSGAYDLMLNSVYYNSKPVFYQDPDTFLSHTIVRDVTNDSNIVAINGLNIYNDRDPINFTSFDDITIVFDATDSTATINGSNIDSIVWVAPTSRLSNDSQIFDMPARAFPALGRLCDAKAIGSLKGDTQESRSVMKKYDKLMARLSKEARFIDPPDDIRDNITPRPTRGSRHDRVKRLLP